MLEKPIKEEELEYEDESLTRQYRNKMILV